MRERNKCIAKSKLLLFGFIYGIWNNVGTVINAVTLIHKGHDILAAITIFLLFLPGVITSGAFLIIRIYEHKSEEKTLNVPELILGVCLLLFCYPLLPSVFCILSIYNDKYLKTYEVLKLLGGFLDDGPQFVLRLIIVVLYQIGLGREKGDFIFIFSMFTSFASIIYHGIRFNEPKSKWFVKIFLIFPMYSMSVLFRSFTLSVFLKETIKEDAVDLIIGITVFILYVCANILAFKLARQDTIRSVIFGCSSLIIPAGYNNIKEYYQRPHQPLGKVMPHGSPKNTPREESSVFVELESTFRIGEKDDSTEDSEGVNEENCSKMRSGLFLLIHNVANAVLISMVAIYLFAFKSLSTISQDAFTVPLLLCIIPGFFFVSARAVLFQDLRCGCCRNDSKTVRVLAIILSILLTLIGYGSLIPSSLWTLIWKVISIPFEDDS